MNKGSDNTRRTYPYRTNGTHTILYIILCIRILITIIPFFFRSLLLQKRALVPLDRLFQNKSLNTVIQGKVTSVNPATNSLSYVTIQRDGSEGSSATLNFDYVVIATGASYGDPLKLSSPSAVKAVAHMQSIQQSVAKANSFVVVGGGATGIELAGELKAAKPDASVTLVHSGKTLMSNASYGPPFAEKALAKVLQKVKDCKVDVILGARASKPEASDNVTALSSNIFVSSAPQKITLTPSSANIPLARNSVEGEIVFWTTGPVANTGFLKDTPLASTLDSQGRIKVELTYQVKGFTNIFALGDVTSSPDAKAGWLLKSLAPIVAENIKRLANAKLNKDTSNVTLKQASAKGMGGMAVMPLGPNRGVGITPMGVLGDGLVSSIKGKDLFTSMAAKDLGYTQAELSKIN